MDETWTTKEAAEHCGITPATWRKYASDGRTPAPLPYRDTSGNVLYSAAAVRAWNASRPGRGTRTDLKEKQQ